MKQSLEHRLSDAVRGSVLEARLSTAAAPFLERRSDDEAARRLDGPVLRGLARVVASQPQIAGFLSYRPELLERIASANAATLSARAEELGDTLDDHPKDLETALDALRVTRHEETCLAACLDLGGAVRFEAVSYFLSILAESITGQALRLAQNEMGAGEETRDFAVVGMGKIGGREFTYHSDLDLIFLSSGAPGSQATAARLGPRLISYLGTMTGAGIAYSVDMRLRPSGQQGVLVTTFDSFERYQLEHADTWEHMAMLRARAIAGQIDTAQRVLDRVRERVLHRTTDPWQYIAELRTRIERERTSGTSGASDRSISLKTGPGGQIDVDFIAKGGLLEMRTEWTPALPSVPAMLDTVAQGQRVSQLLADYRFVRLVESRARWIARRSVDEVRADGDDLELLAELVAPGIVPTTLIAELTAAQSRIRSAFDAVMEGSSIEAIAG
jgi:glutamate-ammonia-ligase adenylyltransferase